MPQGWPWVRAYEAWKRKKYQEPKNPQNFYCSSLDCINTAEG